VHREPFPTVSVLFSEPKIPQLKSYKLRFAPGHRFSALQRAENSSIVLIDPVINPPEACFSALQRAENSSIAN